MSDFHLLLNEYLLSRLFSMRKKICTSKIFKKYHFYGKFSHMKFCRQKKKTLNLYEKVRKSNNNAEKAAELPVKAEQS